MKRMIVLSLLVMTLMTAAAPAEGAVRVGVGFGYRGPRYWGPSYYYAMPLRSPNAGQLKVDTNAKDASVYINGAYAGTVRKMKTISLRSGNYDIEVRNTNGGVFDQKVFVPIDKKVVIEPVFTAVG
jgi:hypothetical protein